MKSKTMKKRRKKRRKWKDEPLKDDEKEVLFKKFKVMRDVKYKCRIILRTDE